MEFFVIIFSNFVICVMRRFFFGVIRDFVIFVEK